MTGVGSPHTGHGMVWPLEITMRGLTTNDDDEMRSCLNMLQKSHAGTGLMHESIYINDSKKYKRS